jgi:hypothetical protein
VFRRQQVRSHSDLMRAEFGEGFDHLRMAAAHATGTAAGVIAPRLDMMRERLEPSFDKSKTMARESARRANKVARRASGRKKKSRTAKRWPGMVGGLMVAVAAAGAVGALVSRRRQRSWHDYRTTATTATTGATGATGTVSGFRDEARATASPVTETAKDKASDVLGQMKSTTDGTSPAGSPNTRP